jgi:hypothetical protein
MPKLTGTLPSKICCDCTGISESGFFTGNHLRYKNVLLDRVKYRNVLMLLLWRHYVENLRRGLCCNFKKDLVKIYKLYFEVLAVQGLLMGVIDGKEGC